MQAILDRHFDLTGTPPGKKPGGRWHMPSAYAETISRMIRAEPNLRVFCYAPATEVLVSEGSNNRVRGVVIRGADGRTSTIEADVVIDATGTGIVAAMAGCECRYGTDAKSDFKEPLGPEKANDQVQLCTLMLVSQPMRPNAQIDGMNKLAAGVRDISDLMPKQKGVKDRPQNMHLCLQWAATVRCRDTRDAAAVAESHQEAIHKVETNVAYWYEHGFAAHIAPKLGIRETRRVMGDHVLSVNDLILPKRPEDTVAIGTYGLDAWGDAHGDMSKAPKLTLTPGGYGIPLRTLLTKSMENLMVVGKSLSATHLAMSAVRVQCIVAQMGHAAGIAAALAVLNKTNLRSLSIQQIQAKLKAAGVPV